MGGAQAGRNLRLLNTSLTIPHPGSHNGLTPRGHSGLMLRWLVLLLALTGFLRGAELTLAVKLRWNGETLAVPSSGRATKAGQIVRITRLSALISQVSLLRADGGLVELVGQYGFIDAESGRFSVDLRNVPPGDYAGLGFVVGLPSATNHADPGQWPAGHPLHPLTNRLHWGWQGGYVFMAVEGKWSAESGAVAERGFSYHLATDAFAMPVRFSAMFSVKDATTVDVAVDLARVLRDVRMVAGDGAESTHSAKGDALAIQLAQAVERAWFWLQAHPTPMGMRNGAGHPEKAPAPGTAPLAFHTPAGFPQPSLPADNPLTTAGVALGERLFSEVRLSGNGRQSCASCHEPALAFSDRVALSRGADGTEGTRNAMPLVNLAWNPNYAWDGGKPRVRDQALAAMTNPIEMHADPAAVVDALGRDPNVSADFAAAFGTSEITAARVGLALEQYLLTLVSADSKFDRALRGTAQFSEEEKRGFELFTTEYDPGRGRRGADCFHCHGGALFSDFGFKHNGLDLVSADPGRAAVTARREDTGKFKTPSLRNVALTAPYMHDGRMKTLEAVVAHYDHGVQRAASLDPNLAKHPDEGLQLTSEEQRALVAFLKTLTDEKFSTPSGAAFVQAIGGRGSR